uniref:Uncharacterized protein n=1 Tax=Haptolina ericina TaxID=156174 RepID=A0A7S3F4X7_9EUKA|mmetsp:Transcript_53430/g.119924  ORF Transcript_53430/g.119924 Transcript_53430/m.119924 type:complete len:204 (+) Transcript_53430:3-614(+)
MEAAASGRSQKSADTHEKMNATFEEICSLLEEMYHNAKCSGDAALETKGCSMSTVPDFLSSIASRIDQLQMTAGSMRQAAVTFPGGSRTKSSEIFDAFLAPPLSAVVSEAEPPAAMARKMLPSMSDQGPEQDGENDQQERRGERDARKGTIDRKKRDEMISNWVTRQQQIRGAATARPAIRQYYDQESARWPPRAVYPPASAR